MQLRLNELNVKNKRKANKNYYAENIIDMCLTLFVVQL